MAKLTFDVAGTREYETGVSEAVLYPLVTETSTKKATYPKGVAWNGIKSVAESPSGAEATAIYADNIKYLSLMSAEEFGGTITAYMYPDEWEACDGSAELATGISIGQQTRQKFGLAYKTILGNDTEGESHGYKLHLVYGALASPSEKNYESVNDSPEAAELSWEFKTDPVNVTGHKPTSTLVLDSTKVSSAAMKKIEAVLYGVDADTENSVADAQPRLPLPDEVLTIIQAAG